jgi:hypothetical protein
MRIPNGDVCTTGSWVITAKKDPNSRPILGRIEEMFVYLGSQHYQATNRSKILIETAIHHGFDNTYEMPFITPSKTYLSIDLEVSGVILSS